MSEVDANAPRRLAEAAAQWLALVESGSASAADLQGLANWRAAHPHHEQIWQRAEALRQRFVALPSGLAMASLDRAQSERRTLLKRGLAGAALLPLGWLLSQQLPLAVWQADLRTRVGERRQLRLADGSSLQLNTASAVDLNPAQQRLRLLEGEIALQVAAGQQQTVDSGFGLMRVADAGVCLRRHARDCEVEVLRGRVEVQPLAGVMLSLTAGERVTLQAQGATPPGRFDPDQPGWRDGVLSADNQPLGDFLRDLERYRPGVLRWAPELERLRITGTFQLADTDRILSLLVASLPIEVQSRSRYWITLLPRPAAA